MPPKSYLLGDGTLTIGEVGTSVDFSAQVESARVSWSMDREDSRPVLSGDHLGGKITWSASLSATVIQDLSTGGLVEFTWTNKGQDFPVTFIPNAAEGKQITGTVTVTPMDVGGDVDAENSSDIEWAFTADDLPALGVVVP